MADILTLTAPKQLRQTVLLPASKSISNRALVVNALAGSRDLPLHVSECDDTRVMVRWLSAAETPRVIDIGAAGTAMRFSAALLAVGQGEHVLTGTERMQNRPIGILVDALRRLGAEVAYEGRDGFPPLRIKGMGKATDTASDAPPTALSLPGNVSSQYISALLMIGPVLKGGLVLSLTDTIVSRPYIDMTLSIMQDFGAQCCWTDERTIRVLPTPYRSRPFYVESDWSAASYWYEMVALTSDAEAQVTLPGLFSQSVQGDSEGACLFRSLGVQTEYAEVDGQPQVILRKGDDVATRLDYDFVRIPDLAQTFVVTCCMLGVPFHFTGLQSLKIKETDRIEALKCELRKLGYVVTDRHDSELLWDGERCAAAADPVIDTYEDHRMAMAFAPATFRLGHLHIRHPEVVSKSYPTFWDDWNTLNA